MYIVAKNNPSKTRKYVQIVKSYRNNDKKTRTKIIKHIGSASSFDDDAIQQLKTIAKDIIEQYKSIKYQHDTLNIDQNNDFKHPIPFKKIVVQKSDKLTTSQLEEQKRVIIGIHDIYGYVFDKLKFSADFQNNSWTDKQINIIKNLVLARIAKPCSKRASVKLLKDQFNISLNLNTVYETMDLIDLNCIEKIKKKAYSAAKRKLKNITIAFYDVTTLYFESFTEDELKTNGYSKDCKFNQPQILFSLLISDEGLPIDYNIYSGNTFEGHTLVDTLTTLKVKYKLNNIIVVADRGIFNANNIEFLENNNFKYILGAKLKTMNSKLKSSILNKDNYKKNSEKTFLYQIINLNEELKKKLIITSSDKRAYKDKEDRNKAIDKLKSKLSKNKNSSSFISNYGYKRFIDISSKEEITINEEKIEEASKWDGLHGIITNTELNATEAVSRYRNLWQVEESFRINKHDISMRPIFHWTPKRIKSHIAISFMSFSCVRHMMYNCKKKNILLSPAAIRDILLSVQATILDDKNKKSTYYLPSKITNEALDLYKIVKKTPIIEIKRLKM